MEKIGENTVLEDRFGNLEITGPDGQTVFIRVEHRRKTASAIGGITVRPKCILCGKEPAIPGQIECAKCHLKIENLPKCVWSIFKNGKMHRSGKGSKDAAFQSLLSVAKKLKMEWDWTDKCYKDAKGNCLTMKVSRPVLSESIALMEFSKVYSI